MGSTSLRADFGDEGSECPSRPLFKRPEPIATGVDPEDLIAGWTLVEDDWGRLPQEKRGSDGLQVRRQRGSRVSPAGGPAASGRDPARSNLRGRTRQTDPWPRPAGRSGTSLVPTVFIVVGSVGYSLIEGGLVLAWRRVSGAGVSSARSDPARQLPGWMEDVGRFTPISQGVLA